MTTKTINEKTLVPEEILEEMADHLESNFNYENTVDFDNPEAFKDKYGQELYEKVIEVFKEKWYTVLGEAIQNEFPSFQECIEEVIWEERKANINEQAARFH